LAVLNVSGGSTVQKGDIIARLDNADYAAAVGGVTPLLLLLGLIFAVVMGVVGGFFPALRAARLQVVQALR
ncbi:MAG: multidrug ABC transporter permease, partial [Gemmatimonadetes bacterium]